MKCTRCKATAVVALPSHHSGFCETCFTDFFTKQVEKGIRRQKLFTHEDNILVALSGGKDSLALMYELARLEYKVTGLHIDLGIPASSGAARSAVENFCAAHGLELVI
ncbi:tRNA(Ile)-lysidine synthetase, partial [Desulfovibrio sp. OttesenSCG-928-G15]|nr:tRNA(Ile)-lysidine synthetase [Desulfovibrio sp. OttesenSCG-928-G15]